MLTPIACEKTKWMGPAGDSLLVQGRAPEDIQVLAERYAGTLQTIYIDPPFNTGKRFDARVPAGPEAHRARKGNLLLEAYDDRYPDTGTYLAMMRQTLLACRKLLREEGTIFLHCDGRMNAHLRLLMDEVFGENQFLNEIVWAYQSGGRSRSFFPRKHDTILFYAKSRRYSFNLRAVPIGTVAQRDNHMRREIDEQGRSYRAIRTGGKEYRYYEDQPVYPGDVWTDIAHLQQRDPERTGFETQKPLALIERCLACATQEGDLVGDCFLGSGTTAAAAARMGRRFLCMDESRLSIALAEKRLLDPKGVPLVGYSVEGAMALDGGAVVDYYPAIASYTVVLSDFFCPDAQAAGVAGLDAVERWQVGFLREGVFHSWQAGVRTHRAPALPGVLEMPVYGGEPCVVLTDCWGERRAFLPTRRT